MRDKFQIASGLPLYYNIFLEGEKKGGHTGPPLQFGGQARPTF